jgi:Tfp pilus assembly protein PilV
MTGADDSHEAGFTLLETIIAFLILAISLALGVETISQGAKTFQRSADLEKATLILHGLAAGPLFKITGTGVISGKADSQATWRIAATAVPDNHARPLLSVTLAIWPRGPNGPVFTYHTFSSAGASP